MVTAARAPFKPATGVEAEVTSRTPFGANGSVSELAWKPEIGVMFWADDVRENTTEPNRANPFDLMDILYTALLLEFTILLLFTGC